MGKPRLGKRVVKLIARLRRGEVLCRQHGGDGTHYFFEPSGKRCGGWTAEKAIASGRLKPGADGLLEDDCQTWSVR